MVVLHEGLIDSELRKRPPIVALQKEAAAVGKDTRFQKLHFGQVGFVYLHALPSARSSVSRQSSAYPLPHRAAAPNREAESRRCVRTCHSRVSNSPAAPLASDTPPSQSAPAEVLAPPHAQRSPWQIHTRWSRQPLSYGTARLSSLLRRQASESAGSTPRSLPPTSARRAGPPRCAAPSAPHPGEAWSSENWRHGCHKPSSCAG